MADNTAQQDQAASPPQFNPVILGETVTAPREPKQDRRMSDEWGELPFCRF